MGWGRGRGGEGDLLLYMMKGRWGVVGVGVGWGGEGELLL